MQSYQVEGVLILQNISHKLKTVAGNAILQNHAVSSENISEGIKIQIEFGFHLRVNVCKFRWNNKLPWKKVALATIKAAAVLLK